MFKTWMKTSNVGRTASRPSCRWDVEAIIVTCGGCEEGAWEAGCEEEPEPSSAGASRCQPLASSMDAHDFTSERPDSSVVLPPFALLHRLVRVTQMMPPLLESLPAERSQAARVVGVARAVEIPARPGLDSERCTQD